MADQRKAIGKYEIVSELGRGGMGVVFKAWEESLQRFVAIKMLGDQLTDDETVVARFLREARSVSDLNHPNVVQVFAVDTHEGRPYFAMEFVEGDSLTELIRTSGRIEPKRAVTLLKEVAAGLSAAHDKGVVHRDIKPDNIMLTKHGGVKVVDFGVARVEDPNTRLTATGMAVGTPNYISPEVCLGLDVDKRSDLFSMGIVLYEMLTGNPPFDADSPLEMMTNVVKAEVPDITSLNPAVDPPLRSMLQHMLEKKPDYRYQDFHEVLEDIEAYDRGEPLPHASKASSQETMKVDTGEVQQAVHADAPEEPGTPAGRWPALFATIAAVAVAVVVAWFLLRDDIAPPEPVASEEQAEEAQTAAQVEPEPPPEETAETGGGEIEPSTAGPTISADPTPADSAAVAADLPTETPDSSPATLPAVEAEPAAAEQPPAPDYSDPTVIVVVNGDRNVGGAIESTIEGALAGRDFSVINEAFLEGFSSGMDVASLGRLAADNGGDVVVIAEVRPAGSRTLEFYGRKEEQFIATLEVTATLPAERRNLGTPWQANVEYTAINASEQGTVTAEPIARDLIRRLDELKASQ